MTGVQGILLKVLYYFRLTDNLYMMVTNDRVTMIDLAGFSV